MVILDHWWWSPHISLLLSGFKLKSQMIVKSECHLVACCQVHLFWLLTAIITYKEECDRAVTLEAAFCASHSTLTSSLSSLPGIILKGCQMITEPLDSNSCSRSSQNSLLPGLWTNQRVPLFLPPSPFLLNAGSTARIEDDNRLLLRFCLQNFVF